MTPNNLDSCGSVSICDIHRLDTKIRDNNELMTMRIMSKYGASFSRASLTKKNLCHESQSCRNFQPSDKQKSRLDSLFDENIFDPSPTDKSNVYPKEKFYGNAKLLLTMNDDILRKAVCDDDAYQCDVSKRQQLPRHAISTHLSTMDGARNKNGLKIKTNRILHPTATPKTADSKMIDDVLNRCQEAPEVKNHLLSQDDDDVERRLFENLIASRRDSRSLQLESEMRERAYEGLSKSSSADFPMKKLSTTKEQSENEKSSVENGKALVRLQKSVSMLSFIDVM